MGDEGGAKVISDISSYKLGLFRNCMPICITQRLMAASVLLDPGIIAATGSAN